MCKENRFQRTHQVISKVLLLNGIKRNYNASKEENISQAATTKKETQVLFVTCINARGKCCPGRWRSRGSTSDILTWSYGFGDKYSGIHILKANKYPLESNDAKFLLYINS